MKSTTGCEIEREIDSRLHCYVIILLKTGSHPLSALNERANERYDVDSNSKIVVLEVRRVVQACWRGSIWEMSHKNKLSVA